MMKLSQEFPSVVREHAPVSLPALLAHVPPEHAKVVSLRLRVPDSSQMLE